MRHTSNASGLEGLTVERAVGDVTEPESLRAAVDGVDVVFHLAGVRRAPDRETFMRVNAEGTRNVCEAMAATGTRMRLVLCGSLAASGPSTPDRPRREEDPFAPEEWYGESKAEAERIAFSYQGRIDVTVIRPARIIGPGDRENLVFFKLVKKGWKLRIGGGGRPLSMVDVDDVVEQMIRMAESPQALGEAFFCAAEETTSLESLQESIARALAVEPRTLYLPETILRGLASAADAASIVTGKHLPLNRKLARQLLAPAWTCSMEKARRKLGFTPKVPLAESLKRSAQWYVESGLL